MRQHATWMTLFGVGAVAIALSLLEVPLWTTVVLLFAGWILLMSAVRVRSRGR